MNNEFNFCNWMICIILAFLFASFGLSLTTINPYQVDKVDKLIDDEIIMIYSIKSLTSQKQIEYFGDDWQKYVASGLTYNCSSDTIYGSIKDRLCQTRGKMPIWFKNGTYEKIGEGFKGKIK